MQIYLIERNLYWKFLHHFAKFTIYGKNTIREQRKKIGNNRFLTPRINCQRVDKINRRGCLLSLNWNVTSMKTKNYQHFCGMTCATNGVQETKPLEWFLSYVEYE